MARFSDFKDSASDPVTGVVNNSTDAHLITTTGSTVSSTSATIPSLTIPSPNFPYNTPVRYMINLPGQPDFDRIVSGGSTFVVVNTSTTTVLTRVSPTGTLTANTYKIFDDNVANSAKMEIHVDTGSGVVGNTIDIGGRFKNFVASSTAFNKNAVLNSTGTETSILLNNKVFEIGVWDMDATSQITIDINPIDKDNVYTMQTMINSDDLSLRNYLEKASSSTPFWGLTFLSGASTSTNDIILQRATGIGFDSTDYSSTTTNRGHVIIQYSI